MTHNNPSLSRLNALTFVMRTSLLGVRFSLVSTPLHLARADDASAEPAVLPELTVSGDSVPGTAGSTRLMETNAWHRNGPATSQFRKPGALT